MRHNFADWQRRSVLQPARQHLHVSKLGRGLGEHLGVKLELCGSDRQCSTPQMKLLDSYSCAVKHAQVDLRMILLRDPDLDQHSCWLARWRHQPIAKRVGAVLL